MNRSTHAILILLVLAAGFALHMNVAYAGAIINAPNYVGLRSGLVGYWSFDGPDVAGVTAYDRSGQGNNGTLTGGPTRAIGRIGQALDINNINAYVNVGNPSSLNNLTLKTFSFWIKPRSIGGGGSLKSGIMFDKNQGGTVAWALVLCTDGDGGASCTNTPNTFYFTDHFSPYGSWRAPANSITLNSWNYIAITYDRSSNANIPTMYVNGTQVAVTTLQSPGGSAQDDSAINLTIGNNTPLQGNVDGPIDDVRIYNRILSADEIKRLYKIGGTFKVNAPLGTNGSSANGLVGYWSFDGPDMAGDTAYDRSGQGNNGTLTNGPARVLGRIGQALKFDGADDYVDAGAGSSFANLQQKSASAWIYPRSLGEHKNGAVIDKQQGGTLGWQFWLCDAGDALGNCSGVNNSIVFCDSNWSSAGGCWRAPSNSITLNAWNHVAFSYSASSLSNVAALFINGVPQTATQTVAPSGTYTDDDSGLSVQIGNRSNDTDFAFDGPIDDVRVYNRILSADEIKRLYKIGGTFKVNAPLGTNGSLSNGLVGYWSFDGPDMAGTDPLTAYDRSGQGNNASSSGTIVPKKAIGKIGQALTFDGTDDEVSVSDTASLRNIQVKTVSAWIYPRSFGVNGLGHVFGADDYPPGNNQLWFLRLCNNDSNHCPSTANTFMWFFNGVGSNGSWFAPANTIQLNQWQHIAVVYDCTSGSNVPIFYYNGQRITVSVQSTPDSLHCTDDPGSVFKTIGKPYASDIYGGDPFNGVIDDVRIYNRALSANEIKRLYNMGR